MRVAVHFGAAQGVELGARGRVVGHELGVTLHIEHGTGIADESHAVITRRDVHHAQIFELAGAVGQRADAAESSGDVDPRARELRAGVVPHDFGHPAEVAAGGQDRQKEQSHLHPTHLRLPLFFEWIIHSQTGVAAGYSFLKSRFLIKYRTLKDDFFLTYFTEHVS